MPPTKSSQPLSGAWLARVIEQFGEVEERLGRMRAKSLGALLRFQERLDPSLFPAS